MAYISIISLAWSSPTDVQTIHYLSKKTSKLGEQTIVTEMSVWLSSGNVRISYSEPEKRDLLLNGDIVSVFSPGEAVQTQNYKDVPLVIRQLLIPNIFAAGEFMKNVNIGFKPVLQKQENGKMYYRAESKRKKNLSHIDYVLDAKAKTLLSYKMYHVSGALVSAVDFADYKLFGERYLLPMKIKTVTTLQNGVLEDEELFSRVKVNIPIAADVFVL